MYARIVYGCEYRVQEVWVMGQGSWSDADEYGCIKFGCFSTYRANFWTSTSLWVIDEYHLWILALYNVPRGNMYGKEVRSMTNEELLVFAPFFPPCQLPH